MQTKIRYHKSHHTGLVYYILSLTLVFLALAFWPKGRLPSSEKTDPPDPPSESLPSLAEHVLTIQNGTTLSDILMPFGFSPRDVYDLRTDTKPVYDLAKIKAGQELRIYSETDGLFVRLEYDIDKENYLLVEKKETRYRARLKAIPYQTKTRLVWGFITNNLISAVTDLEEKPVLAMMLADLFAWDIDFYTDLRQGDSFKILFEKKYLYNEFYGYTHILAAEFVNQGNKFQAFRYTYPDTGKWDYFTFNGDSVRKEFLKSPIKFARISSRFSYSRFHPVRKVYRPHYGVDYAARIGTEVQATADGTVTFTGWNGAAGRMVRIRHKNNYETMYLHLRGYARGIRKGTKVKGGQVIGYVGSSGESTGPHLDYRIKYRGKYINPLAWKFKPVEPLRREYLEPFQKHASSYRIALEIPLVMPRLMTNRGLPPLEKKD
jgi:murein DD-endopeptidase MepM/ murein hydrolase activator NlpD